MTPITKAEVEAVLKEGVPLLGVEQETLDFIKDGQVNRVGWLLVGYEIAKARAEKGEGL